MFSQRLPKVLFAVLVLAAIAKSAAIWPRLPERVAVHFDATGAPNGWSSRLGMVLGFGALTALLAASFLATSLVSRLPTRWINLPNKDYWLATERQAETLHWIAAWSRWLLVVTLAVLVWVLAALLDANLEAPPRLGLPGWFIGGYAALVVAMIACLFWRFMRKV